jgi:hypothetical protein
MDLEADQVADLTWQSDFCGSLQAVADMLNRMFLGEFKVGMKYQLRNKAEVAALC